MKRSIIFILIVAAAGWLFWQRPSADTVYVRADGTVRLGARVVSTDDVITYAFGHKDGSLKVRLCKGANPLRAMPFTEALETAGRRVDLQRTSSGCGA